MEMQTITDIFENEQNAQNPKCKNKKLENISEMFTKNDWQFHINENDHVAFKNPNSDYHDFEFKIDNKKIYVTVPLKNSDNRYTTHFYSYDDACKYVYCHFKIYAS